MYNTFSVHANTIRGSVTSGAERMTHSAIIGTKSVAHGAISGTKSVAQEVVSQSRAAAGSFHSCSYLGPFIFLLRWFTQKLGWWHAYRFAVSCFFDIRSSFPFVSTVKLGLFLHLSKFLYQSQLSNSLWSL